MNHSTLKFTALAVCGALFSTGCAEMTPGENAGVFGATAGLAAGGIARAAGMHSGEAAAIGIAAGAATAILVYVIAKRQATERQRRIAEERARRAYAAMPAQKKQSLQQKKVRYIAVDTERDAKSQGQKSVMVWDTQTKEVVGNTVYDVKQSPPVGKTAKFDTYTAEYVGPGA